MEKRCTRHSSIGTFNHDHAIQIAGPVRPLDGHHVHHIPGGPRGDEREFAIDIGEDGEPVGYEIQFESRHPEVIAEALQILQQSDQIAAE